VTFEAEVDEPAGGRWRVTGEIPGWEARIVFDPAAPSAARLTVALDMGGATSGRASFDRQMRGPAWLGADAHPVACYRAEGFVPLGEGRYRAEGRLTLRGQGRPVPLVFALAIEGDGTARAHGEAEVARLEFGIGATVPAPVASGLVAVAVTVTARRDAGDAPERHDAPGSDEAADGNGAPDREGAGPAGLAACRP